MKVFSLTAVLASLPLLLLPLVAVAQPRDLGLDLSHFQGATGVPASSWTQMFAEGKRFAFIKGSEGLTGPDDSAMANNMDRATAAGLLAGVYHYAHPENRPTPAGAVQEADHFLAYAGNYIGPGYLRPALDLEFAAGTLSTTALTDWVVAFANEIVAQRGPSAMPVIYCSQGFANAKLDSRVASYALWLRTISGVDPLTSEPPPEGGYTSATGSFTNWAFWQYNDAGSSGGISPLDLNVCHSEIQPLSAYVITPMANPLAPTIAAQPQSQTLTLGSSATFSVTPTVASSTPLSYQWRFNGTNIGGATGTAYTRLNFQATEAGSYTVVITNVAGSRTSDVALLSILTPLTLFQESFDAYATPSVVTAPAITNGFKILFNGDVGPTDMMAVFGFDYSTVTYPTTIPSAPHSTGGSTKGLLLAVNKDATAAVAAVNLYPTNQGFSNTYSLKFDLWMNWSGSSGTTEHALFGVNHSGNITNRIGLATSDGLFFAVDGDGGVSATSGTQRDFAVYQGGGPGVIPALKTTGFGPAPLLGSQFDNSNAGFISLFPSKTLAITTPNGSAGLGWVSGEVRLQTNLVTWLLNDTVVAQYTNTTAYTNGNILIGHSDNSPSIGGADNFVIFDNIRVETVNPDADGNGLPDAWETQYFGHTGVLAGADGDQDGTSNLAEYQAGTNPTNAASRFQVLAAVRTNDDLRVDWSTVGGHRYAVQLRTNVMGGAAGFADVSAVITMPGTGEGSTNYVHVGGATNPAAFYRIRLVP